MKMAKKNRNFGGIRLHQLAERGSNIQYLARSVCVVPFKCHNHTTEWGVLLEGTIIA